MSPDWIVNCHSIIILAAKVPSLTVSPVLPLIPLKLQFHLCLDTLIIFVAAFILLIQRKKFDTFFSSQAFTVSIFALLCALCMNVSIQGTLYGLSKTMGQSVFPLFWDSFSISKYTLRWKACLYLGNLFLLSFAFESLKNGNKKSNAYFQIPLITLLLTGTGSLLLMTSNLFTILLALETFSFLTLFVIRISTNKLSSEATLLYFFMNLIATGFLALGLLFIYLGTKSLVAYEIADALFATSNAQEKIASNPNIFLGSGLIFGAFLFKLGAFPLHFWVPLTFRAMTFAGVAVTSFSVKLVYVCFFLQLSLVVLPPLFPLFSDSAWFLFIACGSIVFGTIMALIEFNFRKFVAFTAISQIGFLMLALLPIANTVAVGVYNQTYFISIYFISMLLFSSSLAALRVNNTQINALSDLRLLSQSATPFTTAICVVSIFSMAGLPPTSGFWAKYYIIRACWDISYTVPWGEAMVLFFRLSLLAIVFVNFISAMYYIRLIMLLLLDPLIVLVKKITFTNIRQCYSIFREFLLQAFAPIKVHLRQGLKHVFIIAPSAIHSFIREIYHASLSMEVIKRVCQILGTSFLILDFCVRCW